MARHEVPVAARCETTLEALEIRAGGGEVEHLHLREGREVDTRHLARNRAGLGSPRHEVAVAVRREATPEVRKVGVCRKN